MFRLRAKAPISPTMRSSGTAGIQIPPGPWTAVWSGFGGLAIPALQETRSHPIGLAGLEKGNVTLTYLRQMPGICRFIWTRMCRPNVQFPFLSSYSKIRAPDTSHRGIWYTTRAVKSKPRYMSLPGPVVMKVVVQERTVLSMGGLARAGVPGPVPKFQRGHRSRRECAVYST